MGENLFQIERPAMKEEEKGDEGELVQHASETGRVTWIHDSTGEV